MFVYRKSDTRPAVGAAPKRARIHTVSEFASGLEKTAPVAVKLTTSHPRAQIRKNAKAVGKSKRTAGKHGAGKFKRTAKFSKKV